MWKCVVYCVLRVHNFFSNDYIAHAPHDGLQEFPSYLREGRVGGVSKWE